MTTTFSESTPHLQAKIIENVLDPAIVNNVVAERAEEIIRELQAGITPQTLPGELRAIHAAIWKIREANRPPRRSFFDIGH